MRKIAAALAGLLLLSGLSGCDMTLMQEPTESTYETFGTRPPESDPGPMLQYRRALEALRQRDYARAKGLFEELGDFRDASEYAARFLSVPDMLVETRVSVSDPVQPDYTVRYFYDSQGRVVLEEHISGPDVIESVSTSYEESMTVRQDSAGMLISTFGEGGRLIQTMEKLGSGSEEMIYNRNYIHGQGNRLVKDNGSEQQRRGNQYHSLLIWEGWYTYDDQGRLSRYDRKITWGGQGGLQELYTYDEAGDLIRKETTADMPTYLENTVEEYTWDAAGNCLTLDRRTVLTMPGENGPSLTDHTHIAYTWQEGRLLREEQVVDNGETVTTVKEYIYGEYLSYQVPPVEGG